MKKEISKISKLISLTTLTTFAVIMLFIILTLLNTVALIYGIKPVFEPIVIMLIIGVIGIAIMLVTYLILITHGKSRKAITRWIVTNITSLGDQYFKISNTTIKYIVMVYDYQSNHKLEVIENKPLDEVIDRLKILYCSLEPHSIVYCKSVVICDDKIVIESVGTRLTKVNRELTDKERSIYEKYKPTN